MAPENGGDTETLRITESRATELVLDTDVGSRGWPSPWFSQDDVPWLWNLQSIATQFQEEGVSVARSLKD